MSLPRFNESNYGHYTTSQTGRNKSIFRDDQCCLILLRDLDYYRNKLGFKLLAYVIMPDHLHCVIYWDTEELPNLTISKIMHDVKGHSARQIVDFLYHEGRRGPLTSHSKPRLGQGTQATQGEYPHHRMSEQRFRIWQPSFYDFDIYTEEKLREKLNYIHYNPVRAGLCENPEDYQWSSYRFYQLGEKGIIKINQI